MPQPDELDGMSAATLRIPTNHKEAVYQLAQSRSTRTDRVTMSDIFREYIRLGLQEEEEEDLPEEVLDLLDEDLKANAGGDADPAEAVADGGESE